MQIIKIGLIALFIASTAVAQTASLKDRLKAAQTEPYAKHEKVMIEANRAIQNLPRKMDGTWESTGVQFVIDLMEIETDTVYRQQMLEDSAVHLKDSRAQLVKALKKLPPQTAKALLFDIDSVIKVHEKGNNQ